MAQNCCIQRVRPLLGAVLVRQEWGGRQGQEHYWLDWRYKVKAPVVPPVTSKNYTGIVVKQENEGAFQCSINVEFCTFWYMAGTVKINQLGKGILHVSGEYSYLLTSICVHTY